MRNNDSNPRGSVIPLVAICLQIANLGVAVIRLFFP